MGYSLGDIEEFSQDLWFHYFKKPIDSRPGYDDPDRAPRFLRRSETISSLVDGTKSMISWNSWCSSSPTLSPTYPTFLNTILESEFAGYRIVGGIAADITDEQERAMLEEALADTRFAPVTAHLERALQLLADRQNPDYRNSIKESISAVEAMARVVAGSRKATLGEALKVLERSNRLHPALKDAFSKLYGYTSDEHGIRHAMLEEPNMHTSGREILLAVLHLLRKLSEGEHCMTTPKSG